LYSTKGNILVKKFFAAEKKIDFSDVQRNILKGRLPLSGQHIRVVILASA